MTQEHKVLDHGHVRLVDSMGSDLSVVRSARVSYAASWRAGEDEKSDEKLLRYLWKNGHTTPFEAVTFTFDVKAPIFVFRQWHRHRTQSYNEVSARYTELPAEWYVPHIDAIGTQSSVNKQARDWAPVNDEERELRQHYIASYDIHCKQGYMLYQELIDDGWPRELARMCLPVSIYSQMFATMNLLNCLKFLKLRLHSHAQYEIRVYAEAMLKLIETVVPVTASIFKEGL